MNHLNSPLYAIIVAGCLVFSACHGPLGTPQSEHPVEVKRVDGSDLGHITLTEKAIERIALKTDEVREVRVARSATPRVAVPYSALIYDPQGQTWVYSSPRPRTFVRHKVEVEFIEGDFAVLSYGPPVGTVVASVAVAELYGAEFKVGH